MTVFSPSLRHFPELDPAGVRDPEKHKVRQQLQTDTDTFLARGGEIYQCKQNESISEHLPLKRKRRAQIEYKKRLTRRWSRGNL